MNKKLHPLEQWLYEEVPVDALCLYRIGLGMLIVVECLLRLPHTVEFFSNQGFHLGPLAGLAPAPLAAMTLSFALIFFAMMVMAGYLTRLALAITLGLWSYFFLVDMINEKAAHSIVMVMLGFLLFSDCDARFSVDDWLRRRRQLKRKNGRTSIFVQRLMQVYFLQGYFFSGLVKVMNPDWISGVVLQRIFMGRWATPLAVKLSGVLGSTAFHLLSLCVIIYETILSPLLWVRSVRAAVIIAGICFHLTTSLTLHVGSLSWHFILALVFLFPDPRTVRRVLEKISGQDWTLTNMNHIVQFNHALAKSRRKDPSKNH